MSIDLRKHIVDLSKKAAFAANKHSIEGQRAQVVLVLDISASMNMLSQSSVIQWVMTTLGLCQRRLLLSYFLFIFGKFYCNKIYKNQKN
jgi:hypothetical protein